MKLDIACGQRKQEGYIGIDIAKIPGVDIVHDLEQTPWPIDSGIVEEAYCSHYVEHTANLIQFMNELYRVMKVGARCIFLAPYYNSIRCWQDPTHKRAISEASFLYFNKSWRDSQGLNHYPITCDFDYSFGYQYMPEWQGRSEDAKLFATKHYMNVVSDISVCVVKR